MLVEARTASARPLRHLFVSREYPPASYPPGGIGTYGERFTRALAGAGHTVHVIAERWSGASSRREELEDGRLVVHRVAPRDLPDSPRGSPEVAFERRRLALLAGARPRGLRFAWQAALLAERLVAEEDIHLVEAQEWEAPLYYFLLRRALGLGPGRQPPCLVHLHSPTELLRRANGPLDQGWELVPRSRMEEYCVRAADALLGPSRYVASQACALYRLGEDAVTVIPYPSGDSPMLPRPAETWESGSVLYVGRLEPRKGVLELVDAAVSVAEAHPNLRVDLVGEDVAHLWGRTVRQHLEARIPAALRSRFRFHGARPRADIERFLRDARIAVVPSRWDNLPHTCIEAMRSGLPVLVTPEGGMRELVRDGVSGWIAASTSSRDLAEALRRALATPPDACRAMGEVAAASVRSALDDRTTLRRRVEHHLEVVERGVVRSHRLPAPAGRPRESDGRTGGRRGIGIVVDAHGADPETARRVAAEVRPPPAALHVVEVSDEGARVRDLSSAARRLVEDHQLAGVAVVSSAARLAPGFVSACESALEREPGIGIVSGWVGYGSRAFVRPPPSFPHQWVVDDVAEVAVIRAEAFLGAGGFQLDLPLEEARWDLVNAILAAGWGAVTYPDVLAEMESPAPDVAGLPRPSRPDLVERLRRDEPALDALTASLQQREHRHPLLGVLRLPLPKALAMARKAIRDPHLLADYLRERSGTRR